MNNRIVITKQNDKYLILFIKNDVAVKIRCVDDISKSFGAIYLGRVKTVKNNISASFVSYDGKIGYIPGSDRKPETVFPVILKKETADNKEDELTDKISINGVYVVISDSVKGQLYSKKLPNDYKEILQDLEFTNVIIRSNAKNANKSDIINEYNYLFEKYNHIKKVSEFRNEKSVLHRGIPKVISIIFSEDISEYNEIITDDKYTHEIIQAFLDDYKNNNINIRINNSYYEDDMVPLNALISLSSKMDRATNRKVFLKSDAYLVIDYTEAMTVIDVNSGNTRFKGDKSEVLHRINIEAAKEIALQLKLRNISGIIVVDFINVKSKDYKEELINTLKDYLADDDCHAKCYGMTKLGLVEITRERIDKPLREQLWK